MSSLFYLFIVGDGLNYIVYHNLNYSNWEKLRINASNYMKL